MLIPQVNLKNSLIELEFAEIQVEVARHAVQEKSAENKSVYGQ
jgi:hypothetical protein